MATTPNYGWETPDDTDLISASAAILRNTFNDIDEQVFASGGSKFHDYDPVTGDWFGLNYFASDGGGTTAGNENVLQNEMFSNVIAFNNDVTLDRIAISVAIAGVNTTYRLGIYEADASGNPSNLILDAGTVLGTTTGVKEITISQALTKGIYYLAVARQGSSTGTTQRILGNSFDPAALRMYSTKWFPNYAQSFNEMAGVELEPMKVTGVSGALPATFGSPTTSTEDPVVIVRLA